MRSEPVARSNTVEVVPMEESLTGSVSARFLPTIPGLGPVVWPWILLCLIAASVRVSPFVRRWWRDRPRAPRRVRPKGE